MTEKRAYRMRQRPIPISSNGSPPYRFDLWAPRSLVARLILVSLTLFETVSCSGPGTQVDLGGNDSTIPSKAVIKQMSSSVFEVVVYVEESAAITYDKPLPLDKVPGKKLSLQGYLGVGTAFMISPRRYISAAHVINAESGLMNEYFLRDSSGKIHKINKIYRYSSSRDFIEFDLETPVKEHLPMNLNTKIETGDPVFTIGNAYGEGIAIRNGIISAITINPEFNQWSFIRFSAGASPGNSGGPLLDRQGNVIGIVLRKNETENLNFALPISELLKFRKNQAELYLPSVGLKKGHLEMFEPWASEVKLPLKWSSFRKKAVRSHAKALGEITKRFNEKYSSQSFPKAPRLGSYLIDQDFQNIPTLLTQDRNGNWSGVTPKTKSLKISEKKSLEIGVFNEALTVFVIEVPDGVSPQMFMDQPKLIMDEILQSSVFTRKVFNQEFKITSLGPPLSNDPISDSYGRKWLLNNWSYYLPNSLISSLCTPTPGRIACLVRDSSTLQEQLWSSRKAFKDISDQISFSYVGTLSEWTSWLRMAPKYLPTFLARSSLNGDKSNHIRGELGSYRIDFDKGLFREEPKIAVLIGFNPYSVSYLDTYGLMVYDGTRVGRFARVFEPTSLVSQNYRNFWSKLQHSEAPFDKKSVVAKDQRVLQYPIVRAADRNPATVAGKPPVTTRAVELFTCKSNVSLAEAEYIQFCEKFFQGFKAEMKF